MNLSNITMRTFLLFFILTCYSITLSAQSDFLSRIGSILIGPDNVDVFHDTQSEYYIEKYQLLSENISIEKEDNLESIRSIEKKKFKSAKTKNEIASLKEINLLLDAELETIEQYVNLWRSWNSPTKNQTFINAYEAKKCYLIEGHEYTYSSSDYRLDTLEKGSHIWWNEKVDQMMLDLEFELVEVEPATSKWIKKRADRNCLSADPNDCLVWSLVEVPAKFDTIVIQEAKLGCINEFSLDKYGLDCDRTVTSEEKVESELQIKIYDRLNGKEIRIKEFEEVECE